MDDLSNFGGSGQHDIGSAKSVQFENLDAANSSSGEKCRVFLYHLVAPKECGTQGAWQTPKSCLGNEKVNVRQCGCH